MIEKLRAMMKRKDDEQGFTLVELIVVMAILAVLAAIAVPKYNGIRATAEIKADAATAASIVQAARIQENDTGDAVASLDDLGDTYMDSDVTPQSGGDFELNGGGPDPYKVTWEPDSDDYGEQTVTEGVAFTLGAS